MKVKGNGELVWIAIAMAAVLTSLVVVVYREDRDPRAQSELKSQRIALVNSMRLALAAASEEQNSAVMATTEQASRAFLEQATVELAEFERNRLELEKLEPKRAESTESSLVARVNATFREFQVISDQLNRLALQSSNRKAYALAFGPAMNLLQSLDKELAKIAAEHETAPSKVSLEIFRTISNARLSGLRIQVYLLPHIAEPSDQKMDELEKKIADEDQEIQKDIESLGVLLNSSVDVAAIQSQYNEFWGIESQIISLSRENSDIRSVGIALNEKRKAMIACQDALAKYESAIHAEPIETAIPKGRSQ